MMPGDVFCRISRGEERERFAYSDDGVIVIWIGIHCLGDRC
jgi:hypothetical protein